MIRTFLFYLAFIFSLIVTGLLLPVWHFLGFLGLKEVQEKFGYLVSRYWARFLLASAGVRVTVRGVHNIPRDEAVLFISNHQGNFDIPVLFSCLSRPIGFLAKIELARIPVLKAWMPKLGCVFIDRSNPRQSVKAIQECAKVINSGKSLVIFPEGTRSRGPALGDFKKGSLRLAEKSRVPVVPVSVNGTYKVMEARKNRIGPADVTVTVAPAIYYDQLSKEEQDNITSIVKGIIAKNL